MNMDNDWKSLSDAWRGQAAPGVDVDAVRRDVMQRGRSLRRKFWIEVACVGLYAVLCAYVVLVHDSDAFQRILFTGLGAFLLAYQAVVIWLRRRQLSEAGLDVHSLVDLELRRSRTTLQYWRMGMWTALAMCVVLYAVMLIGLRDDWPLKHVAGLAGGLLGNAVLMPAMGAFGLWRCRRERARMVRFRNLQDQLRAP